MACKSVAAVMDEQALLGLNPNADARYRQRVRRRIFAQYIINTVCRQPEGQWGPSEGLIRPGW